MARQITEAVRPPLQTKLNVTTDGMAPHDMAKEDKIQECAVRRNDQGVVLVNFLPG